MSSPPSRKRPRALFSSGKPPKLDRTKPGKFNEYRELFLLPEEAATFGLNGLIRLLAIIYREEEDKGHRSNMKHIAQAIDYINNHKDAKKDTIKEIVQHTSEDVRKELNEQIDRFYSAYTSYKLKF